MCVGRLNDDGDVKPIALSKVRARGTGREGARER